MMTVALIGLDGSGKTTVGEALTRYPGLKARRIYMGTNLESSNVVLPTTRLLRYFRRRRLAARFGGGRAGAEQARQALASNRSDRPRQTTGRGLLALAQRLTETTYRTAYSLALAWSGTVVLYDRHLYYENLSRRLPGNLAKRGWPDRFFLWYVERVLPRPDVVILLDVPGETARRRKPELSVEEFEDRRGALKACAAEDDRIVVIDATQPLDLVVSEAAREIITFGKGALRLQEE